MSGHTHSYAVLVYLFSLPRSLCAVLQGSEPLNFGLEQMPYTAFIQ